MREKNLNSNYNTKFLQGMFDKEHSKTFGKILKAKIEMAEDYK